MSAFFLFLLFFAIVLAILVIYNRNPENRANYDERQLLVRGNAYKWGFFTTIIIGCIFMIAIGWYTYLASYSVAFFSISIFSGILVFAVYSIVKDAFYSLQNNGSSYMLLTAVCTASQFIAFFSDPDWHNPEVILGSIRMLNLCCGITFLIVLLLLIWKKFARKNEED